MVRPHRFQHAYHATPLGAIKYNFLISQDIPELNLNNFQNHSVKGVPFINTIVQMVSPFRAYKPGSAELHNIRVSVSDLAYN